MSVTIALIHSSGGVVASDGRVFGSVQVENGIAQAVAPIVDENYDKTFAAMQGKVIGGFTGLMAFSGKSTGQHIMEILDQAEPQAQTLEQAVDLVGNMLSVRLQGVNQNEMNLNLLSLCVSFVAKRTFNKELRQIFWIKFSSDGVQVAFKRSDATVCKDGLAAWFISGDDSTIAAVRTILNGAAKGRSGQRFLTELVSIALERGIAAAQAYKYGADKSCGGNKFFRVLG